MKITCATHGIVEWRKDVICTSCNRTHFAVSVGRDRTRFDDVDEDGKCPCGAQLVSRAGGKMQFTGRAICRRCALEAVAKAAAKKTS